MNELNLNFAQQIAQQFGIDHKEVQQLFNSCGTSNEEFFQVFCSHTKNDWKIFQQEVVSCFLSKRKSFSIPTGPLPEKSFSGLLWL